MSAAELAPIINKNNKANATTANIFFNHFINTSIIRIQKIFSYKLLYGNKNSTGLYLEHMIYICFYLAIQNIIIKKVNYTKYYK